MIYTVRYAHLDHLPRVTIGQTIHRGNVIGRIGNSGASEGIHLHIDCVCEKIRETWHLSDYDDYTVQPAYRQLMYFIDSELFGVPLEITTPFCDHDYFKQYDKIHAAYDLIPADGRKTDAHFDIYWNRSMAGVVIAEGFDSGYGNFVHICFEA